MADAGSRVLGGGVPPVCTGMTSMAEPIPDDPILVVRNSPNLRELTTRVLRDAILNMHFKPNERLVERRLCEQTGVSRTCVREALRHLESEGLVEHVPNRGLFVATVSVDEARQIYEVRAALESTAGRMFVERASDEHLDALKAAFSRIEETIDKTPVIDYVKRLDDFYDVLLTGADNRVARDVLRTLRARMNYLRALTAQAWDAPRKAESLRKMREIVDAAVDRDADGMAEKCRGFVNRSAEFALRVLRKYEDEQGAR